MTERMSFDEMVREMVNRGIPRQKAEHAAGLKLGKGVASSPESPAQAILGLPVTIVVPWSYLVSDNAKYGATIRNGKPRLLLTAAYREAKGRIEARARAQVGKASPADGALSLRCLVWLPDNRQHDITNFAKIIADSLQRIVYHNDSQLWETSWIRAGVDVDSPRAEVTIARKMWPVHHADGRVTETTLNPSPSAPRMIITRGLRRDLHKNPDG